MGGAWLHPEPDLWVAEMTDGGPLQLKVTPPPKKKINKKLCHCHRGRINKARLWCLFNGGWGGGGWSGKLKIETPMDASSKWDLSYQTF